MSEMNDLRPLWDGSRAPVGDARLGRELHALYPARGGEVPEDLWAELEPVAVRCSERRRRRYFARKFITSLWSLRFLVPLAATACIALVAAVWHARQAAPQPPLASAQRTVTGSENVPQFARLDSGAVLDVTGEVSIDESEPAGERVILRSGAVHASVPHVAAGRTFTVATAQADVIVRGTKFTVRLTNEGTLVSVDEGLVEVRPLDGHRATVFVKPGERTVVAPFADYLAALSARVEKAVDAEKCDGVANLVSEYQAVTSSAADMSAAVYLEGICAARRGSIAEAIGYFEQVVAVAPPTRAENALARAARLHETVSVSDGTAAWERYLARFPEGLHRDLAHQFLAEHRGSATP